MTRINVSGVIKRLGRKTKFERVTVDLVDGLTAKATEAFEAKAIVQPLSREAVQLLPEGERQHHHKLIHTLEHLNKGDYMHYEGHRWRVTEDANWSEYGYYECVAVRYEGTEASDSESFEFT